MMGRNSKIRSRLWLAAVILLIVAVLAGCTQTPPSPSASNSSQSIGSPGATTLGDTFLPGLGNGGYDVQHYTLDLTVDVQHNTISGTAGINALATQDLSQFSLDFTGFQISSVTVNGTAAS
jgi:hypothetical protein